MDKIRFRLETLLDALEEFQNGGCGTTCDKCIVGRSVILPNMAGSTTLTLCQLISSIRSEAFDALCGSTLENVCPRCGRVN